MFSGGSAMASAIRQPKLSPFHKRKAKERKALEVAPQSQPDPPEPGPASESDQAGEGYTKETAHEKCACHRPGCYRRFTPPPQSPLKKFCSARCRKALRRVILRERRWFARLNTGFKHARDGPHSKAS